MAYVVVDSEIFIRKTIATSILYIFQIFAIQGITKLAKYEKIVVLNLFRLFLIRGMLLFIITVSLNNNVFVSVSLIGDSLILLNKFNVMTSTEKKQEIKFREVYLSDLKLVMNLYHGDLTSIKRGNTSGKELTADFGLPIGIAEQNGKVIGYSRVNIDSNGEPVFKIHSEEVDEAHAVWENLNIFSVKRFHTIWSVGRKHGSLNEPVVNAIERLVDWLNHCS